MKGHVFGFNVPVDQIVSERALFTASTGLSTTSQDHVMTTFIYFSQIRTNFGQPVLEISWVPGRLRVVTLE